MSDNLADTAERVAASVSGPSTPDSVRVARPAGASVGTLFVILVVGCAIVGTVIAVLGWHAWPAAAAGDRITWLGRIGLGGVACIIAVAVAFASPWLGKISASAGVGSLSVEGR